MCPFSNKQFIIPKTDAELQEVLALTRRHEHLAALADAAVPSESSGCRLRPLTSGSHESFLAHDPPLAVVRKILKLGYSFTPPQMAAVEHYIKTEEKTQPITSEKLAEFQQRFLLGKWTPTGTPSIDRAFFHAIKLTLNEMMLDPHTGFTKDRWDKLGFNASEKNLAFVLEWLSDHHTDPAMAAKVREVQAIIQSGGKRTRKRQILRTQRKKKLRAASLKHSERTR